MARRTHAALLQLEKLLVATIPPTVQKAKLKEPVYCMRIWYNGTDSDENAVPYLMLVKESTRRTLLSKDGQKSAIWCADELTYPGQSFEVYITDKEILKLYRQWYDHLCQCDEEVEELQLFREMVQRAAMKLNSLNWKDLVPVTDDFIIFPADGSHNFMDDFGDLSASVPADRIKLLQTRNLLGKKRLNEM